MKARELKAAQALVQYRALIGQIADGVTQKGIPHELVDDIFRKLLMAHRELFKVRRILRQSA